MTFSSRLTDNFSTLVIDASVIINLGASGYGIEILQTIDNHFVTSEEVVGEIKENSKNKYPKTISFLNRIIDSECLRVISLTLDEKRNCREIMNKKNQLHEGEVASFVLAKNRGFTAIIDETTGRKVANYELSGKVVGTTMDLLCHPSVLELLGRRTLSAAVYNALRDGGMQTNLQDRGYIVELIGKERAKKCTSLPGYKELMRELS